MQTSDWFLTNGTWRLGPLTREHALEALGRPDAAGEVFAWREGMDTWARVDTVPELAPARPAGPPAAAPPPPIPPGWPGSHANQPGHIGYAPASPVATALETAETRWFLVGTGKLVVMSVVTLGLYEVYWFYQHWKRVRDQQDEDVSPLPRAIFAVLFSYPLFRRVADEAAERMVAPVPSAGACAFAFIALSFCWRLPDPLWLITLAAVLPLIAIQKAANAIVLAEAPHADPNTRMSGANWVGVAIGGLLLFLVILGTLLPEPTA
jgi:hypothetical protein